jgi:hypothetical protein
MILSSLLSFWAKVAEVTKASKRPRIRVFIKQFV